MDSEIEQNKHAAYEFDCRVRYSDTDSNGVMSLDALINAFQDCSTFHAEALGVGVNTLHKVNRAWLLSHWFLVVERYPELFEAITVGTFASKFRGLIADRNFYVLDTEGDVLVRASSSWVYLDTKNGKPTRPSAEHVALYTMGTPLTMPAEKRKITLPETLIDLEPCEVLRHHIDNNNHVNNGKYVEMALDALPFDLAPNQVRVDFRQAAHQGDVLYPRYATQDNCVIVALANQENHLYSVIEFKTPSSSISS